VTDSRGLTPLFRVLRTLSFVNSTVFTFLLFFWLAPGYDTATTICGWMHGCLWIALSILSIVAVRLHAIPFWLAVVVAVIGGVGPYAGSIGFVVESRNRRLAPASGMPR
jgi:hypothetical protein